MSKTFDDIPDDISELDKYLAERESAYNLKPDTEAKIIWNSTKPHQKTEYAVVYLHGFRASHQEGHPVHSEIAKTFGWNLYLSRMEEHGMVTEHPLLELTEEKLLNSARFALEIGRRIGKKVILMGTSTGGSLSLYLAARSRYKNQISALILYSPLIQFFGIKEKLLQYPLARYMLKIVFGKKHKIITNQTTYDEDKIWYPAYTLQGALVLGAFVQHQMHTALFSDVKCPVFAGYYFKNKKEQDKVVSVPAIKKMLSKLGTRTQYVNSSKFPEAKTHVICNFLVSKSVNEVFNQTKKYLKNVVSHETSQG